MINVTGTIAKSANIVKDSVVIGDVTIGEESTVLFYAVLRGNDNKIVIGNGTNIQDNCTIHTSPVDPAIIGNHVTVGHNAIVHGCKIGDNTLIGMGATVMNGSVIGKIVWWRRGASFWSARIFRTALWSWADPPKLPGRLHRRK